MTTPVRRRTERLTRERIVAAAVELLDATGTDGLTFKALTRSLATGPGAVYRHVADRDDLMAAATDAVVSAVLDAVPHGAAGSPREEVRAVSLALFDAMDTHPWLGSQLAAQSSRDPGGPVTARLFERLGRQVAALGAPQPTWFTATSVLVGHVLAAAGQNAAVHARGPGPGVDRGAFLDAAAARWRALDPEEYAFTRTVAEQLRDHDDRVQFLDGVDLVLTGIAGLDTGLGDRPPR